MPSLSNLLYKLSFSASPNVYQDRYEAELRKESLHYLERKMIKKNRNISIKTFNINTYDGGMISATYFENFIRISNENTPVIIFFHGNSLSNKNPVNYINYCTQLAFKAEAVVININYLQAPKHKFPTALYNAVDAIKWVKQSCPFWQINNDKVYLFGDCMGANAALSAAIILRDEYKHLSLAGMVLIDPLFDARLRTDSIVRFEETPTLTTAQLQRHIDEYTENNRQIYDSRFSLDLKTDFTKLPTTLIISSGKSPLLDDSFLLEKKLNTCMTPCYHYVNREAYYGFLYAPIYPDKKKCERIIKSFIRNNDIAYLHLIGK